jgi:hypothetical protein
MAKKMEEAKCFRFFQNLSERVRLTFGGCACTATFNGCAATTTTWSF